MTEAAGGQDLHIANLDVRFVDRGRTIPAVAVESLDVRAGSSLVVTGPSGCGKSTLLYVLAGLLKPAGGRLLWAGRDPYALGGAARDGWRRRNIGFVFQNFELFPELSPLENVLVPATFAKFRMDARARERARRLLDGFGVPERGRAGVLSRGEQQRVALSRALLFDPPVILADEPTASLDSRAGAAVIEALANLAGRDGRTVIAASHDPALIARFGAELRLGHGRRADVRGRATA